MAGTSLLKGKGPLQSLPTKLVHSSVYDRRDSAIGSGNDMRKQVVRRLQIIGPMMLIGSYRS
jgi:hypothetical protein